MSLVEGFREIVISGRMYLEIEAISPLTIGSGREELNPLAPDIPLLRDSKGRPVIPGSTLKGFFRSGIERILSGLGIPMYGAIVSELMGTTRDGGRGSRLLFTDAQVEGHFSMGLREHVALDPSTMAVKHGPFKQEYVEPGARFRGVLSFRNLPPSFLSLLHPVGVLANQGVFRLGRSKSRGYGQVSIRFGDPTILAILPVETVSFTLSLPAMRRRVGLEVSRRDQEVSFKEEISNCELVGRVASFQHPLIEVEIPWEKVVGCLDSLTGGLRK